MANTKSLGEGSSAPKIIIKESGRGVRDTPTHSFIPSLPCAHYFSLLC